MCNKILRLLLKIFIKLIGLRSDARAKFLFEAYGCKPLHVAAERMSKEKIARIFREIYEQNNANPPVLQKVDQSVQFCVDAKATPIPGKQSESNTMDRNRAVPKVNKNIRTDDVFKPPVPIPVNEIEVDTIDHNREYS